MDTNRELVAHGYSNILAGFLGTVYVTSFRSAGEILNLHRSSPNYLVYVNTLLYVMNSFHQLLPSSDFEFRFYRVGGTTRVSGFMLALATFLLLIVGTAPIGYIREYIAIVIATPFLF